MRDSLDRFRFRTLLSLSAFLFCSQLCAAQASESAPGNRAGVRAGVQGAQASKGRTRTMSQALAPSQMSGRIASGLQARPDSPPGLDLRATWLELGSHRVATPMTVKRENYTYPGTMLAARSAGGSWLVWTDSDWNGHVTPLDAQDRRAGEDLLIPGKAIRAIVAHDEGFALLLSEPWLQPEYATWDLRTLSLARYGEDTKLRFETSLIPKVDILDAQATILDGWGDTELVWSGRNYAVYCATSHNFGTRAQPDIHQGDALFVLDAEGRPYPLEYQEREIAGQPVLVRTGGWSWNVSHSFEQRLVSKGRLFAMLAKGDAYPRGLTLNYQFEPGQDLPEALAGLKAGSINLLPMKGELGLNYVPLALGDMLLLEDGPLISFSTSEDRASYDVGLMKVDWTGKVQSLRWLTETPGLEEHSVRMTRYGDGILIGWSRFDPAARPPRDQSGPLPCCDSSVLGLLGLQGEWLIPPAEKEIRFPFNHVIHEPRQIHAADSEHFENFRGGRFTSYPDGSVAWAEAIRDPGKIRVHRLHPALSR